MPDVGQMGADQDQIPGFEAGDVIADDAVAPAAEEERKLQLRVGMPSDIESGLVPFLASERLIDLLFNDFAYGFHRENGVPPAITPVGCPASGRGASRGCDKSIGIGYPRRSAGLGRAAQCGDGS